MLKLFSFLAVFSFLPIAAIAAESKEEATKKFLIFSPTEAKGQFVLRNAPKTVSSAPKVSIDIKKDKGKKSDPEADMPAEVKTEVKPVESEDKPVDDDDF